MDKNNANFTEGPLFSKMMFYTIPIILTGILQLLFNAADLVIVGQFGASKSNAVAAVGCTASLTGLMTNFFIGCSAGSGITVAHAIGAKQSDAVYRAVHTIIPFAVIGGGLLSIIGFVFSKPLLILMATPDNILELSAVYMKIIFLGMMPNMVFNFGASILRAAGESRKPLYYLTFSGIVNILLNLFFVLVLNMDVAGVALATVIAHFISAVLVIIELTKRNDECRLNLSKMKIYSEPLRKILRLGLPAGIQSSLFSVSNVIIQSSINSLELTYVGVVAGNAAAQNIQNFAFTTNEAFKQTAMNFTGQNVGAGRYDRVRKITRIALLATALSGIVIGMVMTYYAEPLVSIYIPDSADAVRWGTIRMLYICLPFFVGGIMDISTGVLRGMGLSVFPMFASVFGVCVFRVIWIYTVFQIPQYHTPQCLWLSYVISWILTFATEQIILSCMLTKKIKKQKENVCEKKYDR
ncbi:MAG: MATE family efflux transporter [Clostridia bacterium]|nr:MATE family efflux transporter [Clostridia bacterium]